ncbi:MAG: FG-GAP-like repeat-containing protein, partial [Anaerolineales bacterium]
DGGENFTTHTISTNAVDARSVAVGDVDGDGDLDVLSASYSDDKIAWYENDGSQNFTAHTITTTADGARSVITSDLDWDGDLDVLSASPGDDKIAWYENDGGQNFTAHTITTSADGAREVAVGDVDGDGDLDVLSASNYDDTIAWYENDGSQNFSTRTITTDANGAASVVVADVDGDGDLDVLSASIEDRKIAWYEQYAVGPPVMDVQGNGYSIADGDTTPGLADHTDFGNAVIGSETITRTFTIENTGEWELNLIDDPVYAIPYVRIDGYRFYVTSQPSSPISASGGTTTFDITFDPIEQGYIEAEVIIYSDDYTKYPYNFTIGGYGYDNDDIYDAIEIPSVPFTFDQSIGGATLEGGEPDLVCAPGVASVWYKFTPTVSGFYDVDTSGSDYDTVIHVYENGGADPYACNDDYTGSQSRSIFYGTAGTEYHIGVTKYEEPVTSSASTMSWSGNSKESNLLAALDGSGENLILSLNSYSCPGGVICTMVFDMRGDPLLSPDMHVYTSGGTKVSHTNSVMGGYVESISLPVDTYNVDLTGVQTFISETGWSLGYNSASAESLSPIQLHAKDIYGDETINGEVWLRRGDSVDWMGWFEDHSSLFVYATPGTYD